MRFTTSKDFENLKEVTSINILSDKGKKFDQNGIFSETIFGPNEFSCDCGKLRGAWHMGEFCDDCHTTIMDPNDNIYRNGKFVISDKYKVINPIIYNMLTKYINNFEKMINPQLKRITVEGHIIYESDNGEELINFIDLSLNYKETIEKIFKYAKKSNKADKQKDSEDDDYIEISSNNIQEFKEYLLEHEDSVMVNTIPLLPTHLRPSGISDKQVFIDPLNGSYVSINTHINSLNNVVEKDDITGIEKELFEIQTHYQELFNKIIAIISKKDGVARDQILSNKINFSGRAVISLKHDNDPTSITIPRIMFTEIYFPKIISYLSEKMEISIVKASSYYYLNRFNNNDENINKAIDFVLLTKPIVLLNRNPSLHLLSIQAFYISGVTNDYTIKLAKPVLQSFNADFDMLIF